MGWLSFTSGYKNTFLSYFWANAKGFVVFSLAIFLLTGLGCVFFEDFYLKDVLPFLCILVFLMLTIYVGLKRKYKYLKDHDHID